MAMKKRAVPQKKAANDDTVIYKVMIALGMLCVLLLATRLVAQRYAIADYIFSMRRGLGWSAIALGVIAAALLVLWRACRSKSAFWRVGGFPLFLLALCGALACWLLYATWVEYVSALYFLYLAATVLYLVALLYQREFFLLSLVNTFAGWVFYTVYRRHELGVYAWSGSGRQGVAFSGAAIAVCVLLILAALLAASLVFFLGRRGGKLKLFGKQRQILAPGASALPLYICCAVWPVCVVGSVVLGEAFAYYSIFAAAVLELVAAVYYTVKLA